jgi:hypothetical protein
VFSYWPEALMLVGKALDIINEEKTKINQRAKSEKVAGGGAQVFSQWPEALMLVGKALDIQQPRLLAARMAGGSRNPREALRRFQDDPEVRIMLLGLRSHNSGLTLVRGACPPSCLSLFPCLLLFSCLFLFPCFLAFSCSAPPGSRPCLPALSPFSASARVLAFCCSSPPGSRPCLPALPLFLATA